MKYRFNIYGIFGRIHAIFHKIMHPTHKVYWRFAADEICAGDIVCNTCDCMFWCRVQDLSTKELDRRIEQCK